MKGLKMMKIDFARNIALKSLYEINIKQAYNINLQIQNYFMKCFIIGKVSMKF